MRSRGSAYIPSITNFDPVGVRMRSMHLSPPRPDDVAGRARARRRSALLACCLLSLGTLMAAVGTAAAEFVHPGAMNTRAELLLAKSKVAANQQPWISAANSMRNRSEGSLSYSPAPVADVYQGSYGEGDVGGWAMMTDAKAAYLHALLWVVTDNQAHANKSIAIMNAWTYQLRSVGGVNAKLIGACAFIGFANAAELLKHTNSGWSTTDQAQCASMFRNICYPLIQDFQPGYNGNWDTLITHAMMDMGVFLDDQAMFDRAVNYFKNGQGNGSLPNYVYADGTTQETYRDPEHENMGIAGLIGSAQTAWHQGVDLYGYLNNRLLAGAEGVAARVYGYWTGPYPCWETVYNYYHNKLGLPMPNTERILNMSGFRPEDYGLMTGIGFGTLTSYSVPVPNGDQSVGGLKAAYGR